MQTFECFCFICVCLSNNFIVFHFSVLVIYIGHFLFISIHELLVHSCELMTSCLECFHV